MSSGRDHDRATYILAALSLPATWATGHSFAGGLVLAAGCLFGGLLTSPDLDQKHTRPTQRWGLVKWIWIPYRDKVPYHRHWLSHSPLVSTGFVLGYLGLVIAMATAVLSVPFELAEMRSPADLLFGCVGWVLQEHARKAWAFLVGVEVARDLHLAMDWGYSARKRHLKTARRY